MKAFRSFASVFLLLGAVAACSDEGGVINVGEIDMGITTDWIAAAASSGACSAIGCDGYLANESAEVRGDGNGGDSQALFQVIAYPFESVSFNFGTAEEYTAAIAAIPDGVERTLTFVATHTIACDEGSMRLTALSRSNYTNEGFMSGDRFWSLTAQYFNCTIVEDFLNFGGDDTQSITFNGTLTETETLPETPSESTPEVVRVFGTLTLDTEFIATPPAAVRGGLSDGDPFWTDLVSVNSAENYDGEGDAFDGGICLGEAVSLGTREIGGATRANDVATDEDDECAEDTDEQFDVFVAAHVIFDEGEE